MSEYFSAEDLSTLEDLPREEVRVPEWKNKKIILQGMGAEHLALFMEEVTKDGGIDVNIAAKIADGDPDAVRQASMSTNVSIRILPKVLLWGCVNPDGSPMFKEEHLSQLAARSMKVIKRLAQRIIELSDIGKDDDDGGENEMPGKSDYVETQS